MAIKLNYPDEFGELYPESYWKCVETNLHHAEKLGRILFYGFKDSKNSGKRIVGAVDYRLTPVEYETYFSSNILGATDVNVVSQAYKLAKETKSVTVDGKSESFFEKGVDA